MIFKFKNSCELGCNAFEEPFIKTEDFEYKQFTDNFKYKKCKKCENIYLEFIPSLEDVKNIYPKNYGAYNPKNFGYIGQKARNLAAYFKLRRILKCKKNIHEAIEFGCGSQPLITKLKKVFNCKVTLCDIYFEKSILADEYIIGNLEQEIQKIDKKYDLIVFNQVIEHLLKPHAFLQACSKILKPEGVLYFETPNSNGYDAKIFIKNGVWGGLHAPRHFTIFSDKSIKNYVTDNYNIISIESIFNPFMLNESIKNWMEVNGLSNFKKYFRLSNPVILICYILFDCVARVCKLKTGNMYVLCQKKP